MQEHPGRSKAGPRRPSANASLWGWRNARKSVPLPWAFAKRNAMWTMRKREEISTHWVLAVYQALCQALEILRLTSGRVHYHTHYTVG